MYRKHNGNRINISSKGKRLVNARQTGLPASQRTPPHRSSARRQGVCLCALGLMVWAGIASPCLADGATRDLPDTYTPNVPLTVSITIMAPDGTLMSVLEDSPPTGWKTITNISDGGYYDAQNHKVKWGPFTENLSRTVTYEVTPPSASANPPCFAGTIAFDALPAAAVEGDECILTAVPTVSEWGLVAMTLLVLAAGALVIAKQRRVTAV